MKALQDFLRPEFLNRVDEIVCFNHLTKENFCGIARIMLEELKASLGEKGYQFRYDDALVDYLAEKSYSLTYGARNLRRLIQKELEAQGVQFNLGEQVMHIVDFGGAAGQRFADGVCLPCSDEDGKDFGLFHAAILGDLVHFLDGGLISAYGEDFLVCHDEFCSFLYVYVYFVYKCLHPYFTTWNVEFQQKKTAIRRRVLMAVWYGWMYTMYTKKIGRLYARKLKF